MSSATTDCTIATRFGIKCADVTCSECKRKVLRSIADEIEREKRKITEKYARQSWMNPAEAIANLATGKIEWQELKATIDQYYLPRPLFDDGEPVQFGEMATHPILDKPSPIKSIEYFGDGSFVLWFDGAEAITGYDNGERVKRPKPQMLDADGVPIEVGDVLYRTTDDMKAVVAKLEKGHFVDDEGTGFNPSYFTHREPDTQERIDRDAMKDVWSYWKCKGFCNDCPALIDGKRPEQHYETIGSCIRAQTRDLLRRQRELDGRDA